MPRKPGAQLFLLWGVRVVLACHRPTSPSFYFYCSQVALLNAKVLDTASSILSWTGAELRRRNVLPSVVIVRAGSAAEADALELADMQALHSASSAGPPQGDSADADAELARYGDDVRRIDNPLITKLNNACLQLLLALLEGTHDTTIPQRVADSLNMGILMTQLTHIYRTYRLEHRLDDDDDPINVMELPANGFDDGDGYSVTLNVRVSAADLASCSMCSRWSLCCACRTGLTCLRS